MTDSSFDLKAKPAASALLLAIAALWLFTGCRNKAETSFAQATPPAAVHVQRVSKKSEVSTEEVVGTVRAKLQAVLEAKVSGRIEKMLVVPGQAVKAGDLLAQLDSRETQARLDQSVALRDQYARDAKRLQGLLTENAISRQEFETVESHYRVAMASAVEAETMLGYTKIMAPFTGVITRKAADVGDLAAPGRALLEMVGPGCAPPGSRCARSADQPHPNRPKAERPNFYSGSVSGRRGE